MNPMQQMMMQAQRAQREMQKAQAELASKEFSVTKGGAVSVVVKGDKSIQSISIDEDAFDKDNKDMVEEMIAMAINEAFEKIDEANAEIEERILGKAKGGFGF